MDPTPEDIAGYQKSKRKPSGRGLSYGVSLSPEAAELGRTITSMVPGPIGVSGTVSQVIAGDVTPFEALSDAVLGLVTKPIKMVQNVYAGKKATTFKNIPANKTWRAADGAVRFEILDVNAKIRTNSMKKISGLSSGGPDIHLFSGKLADFLDHPELYKAYPEIAKMDVMFRLEPGTRIKGHFDSMNNFIKMTAGDAESLRQGILHEVQHKIQKTENFAKGGDPANMARIRAAATTDPRIRLPKDNPELKDLNFEAPGLKSYKKQFEQTPEIFDQNVLDYFHLYGEAEARQIEARAQMTLEQLLKVPPWRMPWDVNSSKFIFQLPD